MGVLASMDINLLYKQIIMTRRLPFSPSNPNVSMARDEMDAVAFRPMMVKGLI